MSNYITASDIKIPTGLKTYLDGDASATTAAILNAESEVDGYIANKYDLPLSTTLITPLLENICIRVTLYYLYLDRQSAVPEHVLEAYLRAVKQLQDISSGKLTLGVENRAEESASGPLSIGRSRG